LAEVSFGEWLKRQRKSVGLTQEQLAVQVSCATITLRKIEAEERRPSAQIIDRMADIFKIPQEERKAFLRFARGDWESAPVVKRENLPWINSTQTSRTNLPASLTALIGREVEIASIREYLLNPSIRLLTLIGPPGIGKTSLSLEAARQLTDDFPDGIFFAPLDPLDDPNLVASTIIRSLGLVETEQQSPVERLKDGIGMKQKLLVLDNFEHLINGAAQLVPDLLLGCPHLQILITSREALRVPGEWLYTVPPLSLPEASSELDLERASRFSALRLFTERARAVRPGFSLNMNNIQPVVIICAQLNGLPLAIELIAAQIRLMSPETLLTKLNDQFVLYTDGMRALPPRQKSLHNAIDWSYNLLSREEQNLFVRLSVFSGDFTLEAAESVFSQTVTEKSIPNLVASLLDKSLLQRIWNEDGELRFHMLVPIQQYALNHLARRNEEIEARNWHFDYFLELAEEGEQHMSGHGQLKWLALFESEMNNFRAAFEWNLANQRGSEKSLRLANALFPYWRVRSDFHEAQRWLDRALNLPDAKNYPAVYAKALLSMGLLKLIYVDPKVSEPLLSQSIALARSLKDACILAKALDLLGLAHAFQEKFEQAHVLLEESQYLFRATNDQEGLALTNWHLGILAEREGKQPIAFEYMEQSLVLFQEVGDILRQSILLQVLGSYLLEMGEFKKGRAMLRQALSLAYQLGSKLEMGHALLRLSRAERHIFHFGESAQLLSFAQKLFLECGAQADLFTVEKELDQLQNHLVPSTIEAALAQAETWTLGEAITYALEGDDGLI
jgi:predicted ATPase/DNA-binding XRE family transcriptional regulator